MHLKKLEVQGFKSFSEFTPIEFDRGMTAIVGPNGSGKSNVTDAIRWVLGEQSVKTLRGGKMEDVIFNGTQSRRAMNYAEVTMTLDNEDEALPIDFSEIQITRRLYRSGESEYLMNQAQCRLKDILTLMMDTGLGKDGYSIIGQGRVDDVLSSKSEDRRKILEEAAGIVKYKVRRDEAQRKLDSSEQNLIRISDILNELEDQIEPLEEQAKKARNYNILSDEWMRLDIGLALHLMDEHNSFLSGVDQEISVLEQTIRQIEDEILALRKENQDVILKDAELERNIEEERIKLHEIQGQIHQKEQQIAVFKDRGIQLQSRLSDGEHADGSILSEIEQRETELAAQQKKIATLEKQKNTFEQLLQERNKEMEELLSTLGSQEKEVAKMRSRTEEIRELIFTKREFVSGCQAEISGMDTRIKSIDQERLLAIGESDGLKFRKEEADQLYLSLSEKTKKARERLEEKAAEMESLTSKMENASRELEDHKRFLEQAKYKIRTLEELEKSKEGFQEPVRRLMQSAQQNPEIASKIRGIVGEMISVPEEYETAIEIALGANLHHVITQTPQDASFLIRHLKEKQLGRATFLPVSVIEARNLEPGIKNKVSGITGYIGIAADLVSSPDFLNRIVSNLLGRIIIAENMKSALEIAKVSGNSIRVVTTDGDVINPGGSMTGGSIRRRSAGLLGRSRQLEDLREDIPKVNLQIQNAETSLQEISAKLRQVSQERQTDDQLLRDSELELVRSEEIRGQIQIDLDRVQDRMSKSDEEKSDLSTQLLELQDKQKNIASEIDVFEKEITLLKENQEKTDAENKKSQQELDDLRSEVGDMRISVGSIEESLRGAVEISERIVREKETLFESQERRKKEQEDAKIEIEQLQKKEEIEMSAVQGIKSQEVEISGRMNAFQQEKDSLKENQHEFGNRLTDRTQMLTRQQNDLAKTQSKKELISSNLDELKNRMWEDHERALEDAGEFRIEIEDKQAAQKRITELRNKMRGIGPINFAAIEEYDRVRERFTFVTSQKEDIESAKENLEDMIAKLTKEMQIQFLNHFRQINENFKTVFSDLFSGGTAEILLEDEDDILGSDITIRAQPPGKKLQNLTLLSGGERCLTAIALLFSILQLRPAPFCVLDEVEAALDDVNVSRFMDFVKRYKERSQFILVTHRKGTMEACDRIYGVTMQERGISKVLSMQLSAEN